MDDPNLPMEGEYEKLVAYAQQLEEQLNKKVEAPFSEPHYRDKYLMRIVQFKDTLLAVIDAAGLSTQCTNAWKTFIGAYFDPVVLLSNNTEKKISSFFGGDGRMEKQKILFEIGLIGLRPNTNALDARNPRLIYIEDLTRSTVAFILSRTDTDKREGLMQHTHFSSEVEKRYETTATPNNNEQKEKTLW